MKEIINFQLETSDLSKINPLISRYKVYMAYPDEPANGYIFSKDVLIQLGNTILGCPVVAGFMNGKDGSLIGGHEDDLAIDQNNKVKKTPEPIPIGFAAYDQPCWFEEYKGRNYLTTFIYVWDARFPELENLSERKIFQSLEVAVDEEPSGKYKIVKEAYALGLCLLENVSPAFEFSHIEKFSLDDIGLKIDALNSQLDMLKQEYEQFTNKNQLDLQVDNKLESVQLSNNENNTGTNELNTLNINSIKEFSNNQEKEEGEKVTEEIKFSLNSDQIREIFRNALSEYKYLEGIYEYNRYYVECYDAEYAYIYDYKDQKTYRMVYQINNNVANIDIESAQQVISGGYMLVGQKQETMQMSEEIAEESKEEQCSEEKVNESSNENVDNVAMQELNDKSAEDNKELAEENLENPEEVNASSAETEQKDKDEAFMSLKQEMTELQDKFSKMETDMNTYIEENKQLKEFKASIDKQNKEFAIETTLKEVGNILPTEEIEASRLSAENFSLEDIDIWKNEVKAKAFNFSKNIPEKKPFIQVAFPNTDTPKRGKGLWD